MFDRRRRHRARGSGLCLRQSGLMQGDEETRQRVENIHCKYPVLRFVQRRWMQRISVVEVIDGGDYFHHICHVSVHCSIEHSWRTFNTILLYNIILLTIPTALFFPIIFTELYLMQYFVLFVIVLNYWLLFCY